MYTWHMRTWLLFPLALLACSDDEPATSTTGAGGSDLTCFADVDGDGYIAESCGGDDHCDDDPNAYPGQTQHFAQETACGGWDYNGDGFEEPRWTDGAVCEHSPDGCQTVSDGWSNDAVIPKCGTEAFWGCTTADNGTSCQSPINETEKRTQGCR